MSDQRIPRKETFIWKKVSGGIIEVEGSATHYLNPMGARIWELINERNTVDDIAGILVEYDKDSGKREEELRHWLDTFMADLERNGLISFDTDIWDDEG